MLGIVWVLKLSEPFKHAGPDRQHYLRFAKRHWPSMLPPEHNQDLRKGSDGQGYGGTESYTCYTEKRGRVWRVSSGMQGQLPISICRSIINLAINGKCKLQTLRFLSWASSVNPIFKLSSAHSFQNPNAKSTVHQTCLQAFRNQATKDSFHSNEQHSIGRIGTPVDRQETNETIANYVKLQHGTSIDQLLKIS